MAEITCVFNYNENTGKVDVTTHVKAVDVNDKIHFVTHTPGLTLLSEVDFVPLNLNAGDHAPITYTTKAIDTKNAHKFEVWYHGSIGRFACGELDSRNTFHAWPYAVGQDAPSGKTGG